MCQPRSGEGPYAMRQFPWAARHGIKKRRHHRYLLLTADHRRLMGDHASHEQVMQAARPVYFHISASNAAWGAGFACRRVKNNEKDAADLADLLRMGRLPQAPR